MSRRVLAVLVALAVAALVLAAVATGVPETDTAGRHRASISRPPRPDRAGQLSSSARARSTTPTGLCLLTARRRPVRPSDHDDGRNLHRDRRRGQLGLCLLQRHRHRGPRFTRRTCHCRDIRLPRDRTGGAVVALLPSQRTDDTDAGLWLCCTGLTPGVRFSLPDHEATHVTCTAIRRRNQTGSASFNVTVAPDPTRRRGLRFPPSITVPATGPGVVTVAWSSDGNRRRGRSLTPPVLAGLGLARSRSARRRSPALPRTPPETPDRTASTSPSRTRARR